jgi:hypothetical protein
MTTERFPVTLDLPADHRGRCAQNDVVDFMAMQPNMRARLAPVVAAPGRNTGSRHYYRL